MKSQIRNLKFEIENTLNKIMPDKTLNHTITRLMQQALTEGVFPGAVVMVSVEGTVFFREAFGLADIFSEEPVEIDTVFDLASLTKPLATTLAVMKLVQDDRLLLASSLGAILPAFEKSDKSRIRIDQLLTHTAGLVDYLPYYQNLKGSCASDRKRELRNLLAHAPLKHVPGHTVLYSDVGFMILNWVIERISGSTLDEFVGEEIYGPLGVDRTCGIFFIHPDRDYPPVKFAATEVCAWRKRIIKGEVHDENAHAVGGVEGHAGLFATVTAVHDLLSKLSAMYQGHADQPLFTQETLALFLREQSRFRRTLGFDMPSLEGSSSGKYFSKNSVGHLGFTGTSFWMDLDRAVTVILLTNRIHPSRNNVKMKTFRPLFHDAVMETLQYPVNHER